MNSCAATKQGSNELNEQPIIQFQRTTCYGKCPAYTVSIFSNGMLRYMPKSNAPLEKPASTRISRKELTALKKEFIAAGFSLLNESYPEKGSAPGDLPRCIITFEDKQVTDYGLETPVGLHQLQQHIDALWKKKLIK